MEADPREVVRRGYDALSYRYRGDDDAPAEYAAWRDELLGRLPAGADVLDAGCGCGVPMARDLAVAGHRVTGVDVSEVQIERARRLAPEATFVQADLTEAAFDDASFDAVVCLYAVIHVPVEAQPALLGRFARWLRPGGWLLLVAGDRAWTGTEDGWLGGDTPMWWSHGDRDDYRAWLSDAGLTVTDERFVPEGDGGHALLWAQRPR
ncbi:MAG TPA: class I SAM-dependent methyltransferase [Acidimicrobiales bacterium]|nr:class I SAM-dependent methyltransferase [Acidimicrobiales bacterium]